MHRGSRLTAVHALPRAPHIHDMPTALHMHPPADLHIPSCPLQLVEVINEDYNDFISLSTKLVNVDGAVMRMSRPVIKLKVRSL